MHPEPSSASDSVWENSAQSGDEDAPWVLLSILVSLAGLWIIPMTMFMVPDYVSEIGSGCGTGRISIRASSWLFIIPYLVGGWLSYACMAHFNRPRPLVRTCLVAATTAWLGLEFVMDSGSALVR